MEAQLANRLEAAVKQLERVTGVGGGDGDDDGLPIYVTEFQQILNDHFQPFLAVSTELGLEHMPELQQSYDTIITLLKATAACTQPSPEEFNAFLQPILDVDYAFLHDSPRPGGYGDRDLPRVGKKRAKPNPFQFEYMAGKALAQMCIWVSITHLPAQKADTDKNEFALALNKAIAKADDKAKHRELKAKGEAFADAQIAFIKKYFATGLAWAREGGSLGEFKEDGAATETAEFGTEEKDIEPADALNKIESCVQRLEALSVQLGIVNSGPAVGGDGLPAYVSEFQQLLDAHLVPFLEVSQSLGLEHMGELQLVYDTVLKLLKATASCSKPSPEDFRQFLGPVMEVGYNFLHESPKGGYADSFLPKKKGKRQKPNPMEHQYALGNALVNISMWVQCEAPGYIPTQHFNQWGIKGVLGVERNAVFRVSGDMEGDEQTNTRQLATQAEAFADAQQAFVKQYFNTGLTWSAQGGPLLEFSEQ